MRRSEFDLLRIISMMMVLGVHFDGAALGLPAPTGLEIFGSGRDIWRIVFEAITIIGVNCFTLISGYFEIRLTAKSAINFLFQAFFYSIGLYLLAAITGHTALTAENLTDAALILTRTDLWYVPAYFILMLASPWLNAGCRAMTRREFTIILSAILVFTLWGGWWQGMAFNPTGYTPLQLVTIYLLGRYIRMHNPMSTITPTKTRAIAATIYLFSVTAIIFCALYLPSTAAFAYNSPAVMAASVSFFYFFTTLRFSSPTVNFIAASAFSVYLIHKNPLVWGGILKPLINDWWESATIGQFTALYIISIIITYIFCLCIDQSRKFIYSLITKGIH